MQFVDPKELLNATNGGLDIILDLYPHARTCVDFPNRKFKLRSTEKTASAGLKKLAADNNWVVTDFGGDNQPRNGIQCYQNETGKSWVDSLQDLALKYNVLTEEQKKELLKPEYSSRDANPDEENGVWDFNIREQGEIWTDSEIETIFSKYTLQYTGWHKEETKKEAYNKLAGILKKYRFHPVISYTVISNRKVHTFASTPNYPILLIDEGKFKKLYQPKHWDAGKRFTYHGDYIKDYIHGLEQAQKERARLVKEAEDKFDPEAAEHTNEKKTEPKLSEIILCTGGSDALNMAVFGYWVIWMNSETAKLYKNQFEGLEKIADEIYQLPDIDLTGKREAHKLSMQYLTMKTIDLPEELLQTKDRRNKPCKDVRDFLNRWDFWKLKESITQAKPYQFWNKVPIWAGKGDNKYIEGYQWKFRNVRALNFLYKNGFARYRTIGKKNSYMYVRLEGNTVTEVEPSDIKDFITRFLESRGLDEELRDFMLKTTQLNDTALSNLPYIEIDFNDSDAESQFLFFKNKTWRIDGKGIEEYKLGEVSKYIWDDEIIPHRVEKHDPFFNITRNDDTGEYDIDIKNQSCSFFNYLVQTSRVHWRKELEEEMKGKSKEYQAAYELKHKFDIAGPHLTKDEIQEQKEHLINKIFAIGYLLHRFKDRSKTWFVFAMDNKFDEDNGSFGGSGKSLTFNIAITHVLRKWFYLGGRNPKLTDNQFLYDGLTEHHRYIMIDDADEYLNFKFFFDGITGNLKVNPKNSQPYMIDFKKLGKFAATSNFRPRDLDPSTERRLLYAAYSDYYHNHGETDDYLETRRVSDDFGKNLFDDFDDKEWLLFFNTMAQCLRFYLSADEKINPPMDSVRQSNLISAIGQDFHSWADVFFAPDNGTLDRCVIKEYAFEDFRRRKKSVWKMNRFTKSMKAWCKLNGYTYGPKELIDKSGRIIRKAPDRKVDKEGNWTMLDIKVSTEMMYVQTKPEIIDNDELPF